MSAALRPALSSSSSSKPMQVPGLLSARSPSSTAMVKRSGSSSPRAAAARLTERDKDKDKEKERDSGAEPEEDPDATFKGSVSFLPPDTIRWMNRRRPNAKHALKSHVLPSRALQLREIFDGLDFDRSGSIDVDELAEAIEYVAKASSRGNNGQNEPLFKDPKKIVQFFAAMDTNGDGTVDFHEFLLAMTHEASDDDGKKSKGSSNSAEHTARMQNAFFEFANKHRRQKITDFVQSNAHTDQQKYYEMKKLFQIKYFKNEPNSDIVSVSEQLQQVKEVVQLQRKAIQNEAYRRQKQRERIRAREAKLFFEQRRAAGETNPFAEPFTPSIMCASANTETEETKRKAKQHRLTAEKRVRQRFAEFSLHDHHTFTPPVESLREAMRPENVRRAAKEEAMCAKTDKYLAKNIPPILPPVSMRQRLVPSEQGQR